MMRRAASIDLIDAGRLPLRICDSTSRACERKPSFGSAEKIFVSPAVDVTIVSQVIGRMVMNEYFAFPILMITVVPTHNATVASN